MLSLWTVLRDWTHLVLMQGISQMQSVSKAWAEYYKKSLSLKHTLSLCVTYTEGETHKYIHLQTHTLTISAFSQTDTKRQPQTHRETPSYTKRHTHTHTKAPKHYRTCSLTFSFSLSFTICFNVQKFGEVHRAILNLLEWILNAFSNVLGKFLSLKFMF